MAIKDIELIYNFSDANSNFPFFPIETQQIWFSLLNYELLIIYYHGNELRPKTT